MARGLGFFQRREALSFQQSGSWYSIKGQLFGGISAVKLYLSFVRGDYMQGARRKNLFISQVLGVGVAGFFSHLGLDCRVR